MKPTNFPSKEAIIIAPAWPSNTSGYRLAIRASLLLYANYFPKIYFICISDQPFLEAEKWSKYHIEWIHIPIVNKPMWVRFLRSLISRLPALCIRYYSVRREVVRTVSKIIYSNKAIPYLIIEDIPTASLMEDIVRIFSQIPVAIRSHNMTEKAYGLLRFVGSPISRVSWQLEIKKVRAFERSVCMQAENLWVISREDAVEYVNRLSVQPDGVLGVCMDVERYQNVKAGDAKTIVNVGTADLRKGIGISQFIQQVWPQVLAEIPEARFVLAGRGTDLFTNSSLHIEGLGFVKNDEDVLSRGLIFVNPQQMGAGIQLKSIVAMLAGKALVSTYVGVEGIEGHDGEHYLVASSAEDMAAQIISLMRNVQHARSIGQKARELALRDYNEQGFIKNKRPLLDAFTQNQDKQSIFRRT
jgi:glycosyltransferase involved in cell wall biosynthesis